MFGRDSESTLKNDRVRNMTEIRPAIPGFVSTCFIQASFPESIRTTRHHSKTSFTESPLILAVNKQVGLVVFGMVKHVYSFG